MAFAVRRPPPASARDRFGGGSESEEEGEGRSEAITSFDGRRGTSSSQKGKSGLGSGITQSGKPLVIPSQKNKDWKAEAARLKALKNGAQRYRPGLADESSGAQKKNVTEQDLKDASKIESNSAGGLAPMKRSVPPTVEAGDKTPEGPSELSSTSPPASSLKPIDADEAAYRALLKEASGVPEDTEPADIEAIHGDTQNNFWDRQNNRPMGEEDLFRADVDARPDSATMQDYERVPVEAFGAALLRGMYASGSNTRQTPVEPYVPKARPNLLGIGAKELDLGEDKNSRSTRDKERQRKKESMHFVPLLKKEKSAASTEVSAVSKFI